MSFFLPLGTILEKLLVYWSYFRGIRHKETSHYHFPMYTLENDNGWRLPMPDALTMPNCAHCILWVVHFRRKLERRLFFHTLVVMLKIIADPL